MRDVLATLSDGRARYGDVVRFVDGHLALGRRMTAVFHPDGVQRVLATAHERYPKAGGVYEELGELLGRGLLTSSGELWHRQRRLIQPMFTPKAVEQYVDLMREEARTVVERWRDRSSVDVHEEMIRYTLRVIGRSVFGTDTEEAVDVLRWAVPVASNAALFHGRFPVRLPHSRRSLRARQAIYDVVDGIVARRRREGGGGDDLLARLMAEDMPDEQVRDEALIFLLAGHETTASALTFTLWLLGRHPDQQENPDRTALLDEGMRLYPPVWGTSRVPVEDDEVLGHVIPAGTVVMVAPWVTHRHPDWWDAPQEFRPGRTPAHRYAYFPFGGGPRACIGAHFAVLEAEVALDAILDAYRLTSGEEPELDPGITLRPAGPVPIALTPVG